MSQPTLSGLIRNLESNLGLRLFNRDTKRATASQVGAAFLPFARLVLSDLDKALANVEDLRGMKAGSVRLAAPELLSCSFVTDLLPAYRAEFPRIDVRFSDVALEEVISTVLSGENDIGILPFDPRISGLDVHSLLESNLWVVLPAGNRLIKKRRIRWRDIRDEEIITTLRHFADRVLSQVRIEDQPKSYQHVWRPATALSMVSRGMGISIAQAYGAELVHGFGLSFKPLHDPVISRTVVAVHRSGVALSPACESFFQFLSAFARHWPRNGMSERARNGRAQKSRGLVPDKWA